MIDADIWLKSHKVLLGSEIRLNDDPDKVSDSKEDYDLIYNKSIDLLAFREHSRKELITKLKKKFPDSNDLIIVVLDRLLSVNLQSDERFSSAYSLGRAGKGYGPRKIYFELKDRGVSEDLIGASLQQSELDWYEIARKQWKKKFRVKPKSHAEKCKQRRFMDYRGFYLDHYQSLIS